MIDSNDEFYITIGTEEGKNRLFLQDNTELDTDQFTTNEIIMKIIDQIETYHNNRNEN